MVTQIHSHVRHSISFDAIQSVPRGKFSIPGGHNIGHCEQKIYMYMCAIPNGFRDRTISLYSSKIVDKKEILRTDSNTVIYCSSDRVCKVYLVEYIFLKLHHHNQCTLQLVWGGSGFQVLTANGVTFPLISLNSCEEMACCLSVQYAAYCTMK
jgi:hypothetical protein